jgi:WD40 repeat protein
VYRYDATPIASEFDGVWTVRTDATDNQKLDESNGTAGWFPKWSPEGTRIAGTVSVQCLTIDQGCTEFSLQSTGPVSWSPDGSRVALSRSVGGNVDVYVRHPDGTLEQLTTSPASDRSPAWSPDGTKIAFISTRDGDSALYTMNSDGTSQARVPEIAGGVIAVDWQPVPVNDASGYPRPKGASPMRLSLVPAFEQCTTPNEEHGPPLAFGSCSPPTRSSSRLVVGATDNLPAPNESVGSVRVDVIPGIPGPPDDAEVHINFNLTNVMYAADFSDYNGELKVVFDVTPTDKDSGAGSTSAYEFPLELKVQCNPTADTTIGATCLASTTVDALVPGVIEDGARTVWTIDQLRVRDGGNDGDVDTVPNFPFMTQGLFVP